MGLPGSGKSTYLNRLGIPALSSDAVRQLLADDENDQTIHGRVFATIRYLLRHRVAIGRPVNYVDATHLVPRERKPYIRIAQRYGCRVEALFFNVPVEVCKQRNRHRERHVPDETIDRMAAGMVHPTLAEGFDYIEIVKQ